MHEQICFRLLASNNCTVIPVLWNLSLKSVFCSYCFINVTIICIQLFQNHSEVFIILVTALPLFLLLIVLPTFSFLSTQYTIDTV